jgi:Uncharacterised nucleotidyltransferase
MSRLKGIARYAWFSNRNLLASSAPVLKALNDANISLMLLKGMALTTALPEQMPLRPMGDVDILVYPEHAHAAMDVLNELGWWPYYGTIQYAKSRITEELESYGFEHGPHLYLDLHWYMLKLCRWPTADERLWSRAAPGCIAGQRCHVPEPEKEGRWTIGRDAAFAIELTRRPRSLQCGILTRLLTGLGQKLRFRTAQRPCVIVRSTPVSRPSDPAVRRLFSAGS